MKTFHPIRALALVGLLTGSIAFAQPASWTGTVTDEMCGAKHMMAGGAANCTRKCVGAGSAYALIVNNKIYTLKGHAPELNHLAGQKVIVTGKLSGTAIDVSSVAAAK